MRYGRHATLGYSE